MEKTYLQSVTFSFGVAIAGMLGGCASLDPAADIDRSATIVAERSGHSPDWAAAWDDVGSLWDGRSTLDADTAVAVTLRNNRSIRIKVEQIAAARADLVQAHLVPNPIVSAAMGFPIDGLGGSPAMAGLVQELSWLWKRPVMIDAAEAELRATILAVSDQALTLVAKTRRAHLDVLINQEMLAIQQENVALIEQSRGLVEARYDVGEASRLDLNRIELDLTRAMTRLVDQAAELDGSKRTLLELMGRSADSAEWTAVSDRDDTAPGSDLDESRVIELAAAQRVDVAAARATVAGHDARIELAKRGALPDVGAGAGFERNFSNRRGIFPRVQVTPKVFDDNRARIALAETQQRQAVMEADRFQQAAITEARNAWIVWTAETRVLESYDGEILALAESNLQLARNAYEAGEADLTTLLEAQRQRNEARQERLVRSRRAMHARIELERAVGGSLQEHPDVKTHFSTEEDES